MNYMRLVGLNGTNPLGFMATLGLLRIFPGETVHFSEEGDFRVLMSNSGNSSESELSKAVASDAESAAKEDAPWWFTYTKTGEKKSVADIKSPPADFRNLLQSSIELWLNGSDERVQYAASYGTDVAVDKKGNTKPTAFHFTAAQQTFLGTVKHIGESITEEWVSASLFEGNARRPGNNLRWDPGADRNWALMANDPSAQKTWVDAPLEWLAFRGLTLLPSFPQGLRIITTSVSGRGAEMKFSWPLWSVPATLHTVRSLLHVDWAASRRSLIKRGIFAVCSSNIRRTSQGFGNFAPSDVKT